MARRVWKRKKGTDLNAKLNNSHHHTGTLTECYFRELDVQLVKFIEESDSIVGCFAWLTNQKVMKALVGKPCCMVLQNESWLNKKGGLAVKTRNMYSELRASKDKFKVDGQDIEKDIYVCGMISHPQNMHHKFAVRIGKDGTPQSVWTGSFNPTTNGNQSIENALVIHNEETARAYIQEFLQVRGISKPLKI